MAQTRDRKAHAAWFARSDRTLLLRQRNKRKTD